jgi:hypothetical protein
VSSTASQLQLEVTEPTQSDLETTLKPIATMQMKSVIKINGERNAGLNVPQFSSSQFNPSDAHRHCQRQMLTSCKLQ